MVVTNPIPVAVLGATGSVGQRFVQLLANHPWFRLAAVTGSDRTVGQPYGEACRWVLVEPMPASARHLTILPTDPTQLAYPLVFSALPSDLARIYEPQFAAAGAMVCSNASAYRVDTDVPLLLPEVNPEHATLLSQQRLKRGWSGGIVTNPNCTSTGLTVALKALQQAFGLRRVFAVSLQALSGAGYPGVASLDVMDNVIPYIGGEEEKVEWEPRKMLGKLQDGLVSLADVAISAHTNRVAVSDGHLVCASLEFDRPVTPAEAAQALAAYQAPASARDLPSAPHPPILVRSEPDRPQPRLDRWTGSGMTTVIGRVRTDPLFHVKLTVLSHNTVRGAAGGSIYNAELLLSLGYLEGG
jgi:aspartate-semialdehyde dehydrogenase